MSQLQLEQGSYSYPKTNEGYLVELEQAGFIELASRRESGIEVKLLWREMGNLVLLEALSDDGERASTTVDPEDAYNSLQHPALYFTHDANGRIFGSHDRRIDTAA